LYGGVGAVYLALGLGFVGVVPIGEAPDEPAHLAYVDTLVRTGHLPLVDRVGRRVSYESYQPPLDYGILAAWVSMTTGRPIDYPFQPTGTLDFNRQGSRAVVPRSDPIARQAAASVRKLRAVRLGWGLLTVLLTLRLALLVSAGDVSVALVSAVPFVLAPQFLFVSATINNDGAVTALATAGLYYLARLLEGEGGAVDAVAAGALAGAALWGKESAFFLAAPLLYATLQLVRRGKSRWAAGIWGGYLLPVLLWFALSEMRFQALLPPPPTGFGSPTGSRIGQLLHPHWLVSLGGSFWAKLGWLDVRLPAPLYAAFLLPTGLVAAGVWRALRPLRREPGREGARLLVLAALANLGLVVLYMMTIDWQPQGRYLFPTLAAFAALATFALRGRRPPRWLTVAVPAVAIAVAVVSITTIAAAYAVSPR